MNIYLIINLSFFCHKRFRQVAGTKNLYSSSNTEHYKLLQKKYFTGRTVMLSKGKKGIAKKSVMER